MLHQVRRLVGAGDMTWRHAMEFYAVMLALIIVLAPAALVQRVVDWFNRR